MNTMDLKCLPSCKLENIDNDDDDDLKEIELLVKPV